MWPWAVESLAGERVDRVVMIVEDQIVLESDVRLEAALLLIEPSPSLLWVRQPDPEARAREAAALRVLAGDISLYQPSSAEIAARVVALSDALGGQTPLDRWLADLGVDREGLGVVMRRRLVAESWATRNVPLRTDDPQAWMEACSTLIEHELTRLRIRVAPLLSP